MSEETLNNTLQYKILNFVKKNLKNIIFLIICIFLVLISYIFYKDLNKKKEIKLSEEYVLATINFKEKKEDEAKKLLENIIVKNHKFYSPLALYFIIDNNLEKNPLKIINSFDKILLIKSIDKENLNLIKIKKAIFLFNQGDEKSIIDTLNPVINSDSVWKNMAINLISDYFLSKGQKKKSKEYIKLLNNKISE